MDAQGMILGLLRSDSMTGYEIKKVFSVSFAFFSGIGFGSIYPALRKMEQEGLITMRLEIQDGAPNRKIYTITDLGRKRLKTVLTSPLDMSTIKSDFLSRMFFFSQLSRDERERVGEAYLLKISDKLGQMEAERSEIERKADPFQRQCFEFGIRFYRDLAENVSACMASLADQP